MARFEQEYCVDCVDRGTEDCAIPTTVDRLANTARKLDNMVVASLLGVYRSTLVGGLVELDFNEQTRVCADEHMILEGQEAVESETAVVIAFPRPKQ